MSRAHPILFFLVRAAGEERVSLKEKLEEIATKYPGTQIEDGPAQNQFVISGKDEAVLEELGAAILQSCNVEIGELKIRFLETVRQSAVGEGKYIRQTGGRGNYGHCWLRIEPGERGSDYAFRNEGVRGLIPDEFIGPIDRGVQGAMQSGILAGFPMVDLKVTLFDGSHHETDSNPTAFQFAAEMAFKEALKEAAPFVLEPVMAAEVITPEESIGAVIGDINARRGRIVSMEHKHGLPSIHATLPLAEVLRSSTYGRPDYALRFAGYEATSRGGGFFDDDAPAYAGKPRTPGGNGSSSAAETES